MEELKKLETELEFKLFLIDAKGMYGKTREILGEKGSTVPLLIDSGAYSRKTLKTMYTPTTFIIDREGKLRARLVGGSPDFNEIVAGLLKKI